MSIVRHIPNIITCGNLLSGVVGIMYVIQGELAYGAVFMMIGAVLDFFDGFVARLLNASSPIGGELDSLADVVTFGVLPGIMVFVSLSGNAQLSDGLTIDHVPALIGLLIPAFSAVRLATFNLDTTQTDHFRGLPTPANGIFWAFLVLTFEYYDLSTVPQEESWILAALVLVFCFLLISRVKLIALKFKGSGFKENLSKYLLIGGITIIVAAFGIAGVPAAILYYIAISILFNIISK